MSARPRPPFFAHEAWFVALCLVAVLPVGLLLLWTSRQISRRARMAVTVAVGALLSALGAVELETGVLHEAGSRVVGLTLERVARGSLRVGRAEEAMRLAERAARWVPESGSIAFTAAEIAEELGDERARGRWLHRAVRPGVAGVGRSRTWVRALGRYHVDRGTLEGAERALELLEEGPHPSVSGGVLRAALERARGHPEEAEEAARRVVRAFAVRGLADAYEEIARARAMAGDHAGALAAGLEAYRHDITKEDVPVAMRGWARRGGVSFVPYRAAMTGFWLRGSFGSPLRDAGDSARAARLFEHVVERFPDFPGVDAVLHSWASHWFYQAEEYERALGIYRRILREHPEGENRCRAMVQVAKCHGERGRYAEAMRWLRSVDADCPGGLVRLADQVRARLFLKKRTEE